MKILTLAVFAVAAASPAVGQQPKSAPAAMPRMEAADLALDLKKLVGKRVTVTDCLVSGARIEFAVCPIITKNGIAGMIRLGYADADRAVRKRAVDECSDVKANKRCMAEVTGRVRESATGQVIGLEEATLNWIVP